MYLKKTSVYQNEVLLLLHELMYTSKGCLSFKQLQAKLGSKVESDMRHLCLHGMLSNYIEFKSSCIQLTERGMQHYLEKQTPPPIFDLCS
ncbi:hypothetical protein [Vibrio ziniensis]|uniref:Uncharacterized protein n=1 Tax=Vibrio ziniensis TaxID=2711221 RepID=A0A6G7CML3_9VIBR|nr:hypothetical protein [Vibrio ziniensis]QIH43288.1 hypothetical protein G5S32_18695 [Vibrio ziniensis]